MNTTKDEYSSHITDIEDVTLDFLSKSGVSGWPTILGILSIMFINPDSYKWLSNSGIDKLPAPEYGDNVHWYKIKFDLKSNFRRSVPISLLKNVNMFSTNNVPDQISNSTNILTSKKAVYFVQSDKTKVCLKTELCLNNCKDLEITGAIDVITNDNFDYILTPSKIYKLDNTTLENPKVFIENKGILVSFCLANDVIVIASSDGGYRVSNISEDNPSITKINRYTNTYTPQTTKDSGNAATSAPIPIQYDNGVPSGECKYCWYDGSVYYIGDYSSCGKFSPSDTSFSVEYSENMDNSAFITSGTNRNHNGIPYVSKNGTLLYGTTSYLVSDVKSILELDNFIFFGTGSGIKVFSKNIIDNLYGPTSEYTSLGGVSEQVNAMCFLYNTVFAIGQNNKFRSFDSEEDENKLRIILFGTDYDTDVEANETDAKEVKLSLTDLLDLGIMDSKVFDTKLSKANTKSTSYAISVYDDKPKVFNLYGNDNRNASAFILKADMKAFDIDIED